MEPNESRRLRRYGRRARKAPVPVQVEALEGRQLLAWSPLGFSLPDLAISGFAAPVAAYGEEVAVTVRVQNLGASSITEPLALEPGAPSTADAPPSTVSVWLSRSPRFGPGAIRIGDVEVPAVRQNSFVEITDTVPMPPQLPFLPPTGERVYLYFRADTDRQVLDRDRTNNQTLRGVPVRTAPPLPELVSLAIDVPPVMQPGDAITPTIKIANLGTTNPNQQAAFEVALVASTDQNFGPGDQVLATYTVLSVPPLAQVPMQRTVLGDVNVEDPINILTIETPEPIILPTTLAEYIIGVVIDPQNVIREIGEIGQGPGSELETTRRVGPPIPGLPPAGVLVDPLPAPDALFPFIPTQPNGRLPTLFGNLVQPPIIIDPVDPTPTAPGTGAGGTRFQMLREQLASGMAGQDQTPGRQAAASRPILLGSLSGRPIGRGSRGG